MTTQRERVLYSGHNTTITERHAIVGGRAYTFASIERVSLDTSAGWTPLGRAALLTGVAIVVAGYLAWGALLAPIIGGGALAIAGAALVAVSPRRVAVKIIDGDGAIVSIPVTSAKSGHEIIAAIERARAK